MRSGEHPLRWVPPLVLGICGAVAAEVGVALLLYGGPGLMRSLTAVLSVEAAALGAGLATSPRPRADLGEALRKRWLFALVAFLAATVFSASWSLVEALGGSALGQGLGLALLAALPLYAVGGVLGAMAAAEGEPGMGARRLGGPAGVGAALGFLATGFLLPQVFAPASLLLAALVLLSAGGMIYGATLDGRAPVDAGAAVSSAAGEGGNAAWDVEALEDALAELAGAGALVVVDTAGRAEPVLPPGWRGGRYVRALPGQSEGGGSPSGPEEILVLAAPGPRPLPETVGGFVWVEALRP